MKALHSKDFKIADGDLVIVPRHRVSLVNIETSPVSRNLKISELLTLHTRQTLVGRSSFLLLLLAYLRMFTCRQQSMPNSYRSTATGSIVIREKEVFRADCVLSLVDTRFVLAGEQYSSRKGALTQNCILVLKSCKHVVMYT